jgi:hypothetical protein
MADSQSLLELLREQKAEEQRTRVDWTAVRTEWLADLRALGDRIEEWLHEPVAQKLLRITKRKITLREEALGAYAAPSWEIHAPSRVISVLPVGRVIIGGVGGVDVECGLKRSLLIRTDSGKWEIWDAADRTKKGRSLDEGSFTELLKHLLS